MAQLLASAPSCSSASRGTQTPNHSIARGRSINASKTVRLTKTTVASATEHKISTFQTSVSRPAPLSPVSCTASSYTRNREQNSKDHNSVTIKHDTSVKDAAGAIFKVLNRMGASLVTALRLEDSNEALNQAVKSLAVARKYIQDNNVHPETDMLFDLMGGSMSEEYDLTFLPFNRCNNENIVDPNLFAFMVFKTVVKEKLLPNDITDLNVSKTSDVTKMANAICTIICDRQQAVMKAGGKDAIFVAMSAVSQARKRLLKMKNMDIMLVPSFVTENTSTALGRESKFIKFNIITCEPHGPRCNFVPTIDGDCLF